MDIKFNLTNAAIIFTMMIVLTMVFAAILEGFKWAEGKVVTGKSGKASAAAPTQTAA